MTEFLGRGDPKRTLELLWGRRPVGGRGRPAGISVEAIAAAGLAVVGEEGLEALSMRRVAERMGVGTMSLYTHIRSKAELLDLMVEAVYGERGRATRGGPRRRGGEGPGGR